MGDMHTVETLRQLRHDFGNYLQVILGYIDLNQPYQAREYILEIVENLAAERNIFEIPDNQAILYFYNQLLKARNLGIILRYKDLNINSWSRLMELNEPFNTLSALSQRLQEKDDNLRISLSLNEIGKSIIMLFEWQKPEAGKYKVIIEELK
ncbi:MAG: Spo0B domain-containing protein [Syntrophomonadaceae bacterium]|jgi:stage 0 sporulation protein B (sporulation initiation phosphotransferase)